MSDCGILCIQFFSNVSGNTIFRVEVETNPLNIPAENQNYLFNKSKMVELTYCLRPQVLVEFHINIMVTHNTKVSGNTESLVATLFFIKDSTSSFAAPILKGKMLRTSDLFTNPATRHFICL